MTGTLDDTRFIGQMRRYNPWWSGKRRAVPDFRRVVFHRCVELLEDSRTRRAIVLNGPRRVGKSTILHQLVDHLLNGGIDSNSILYLSLDDNVLKLASLDRLLDLYREAIQPEGRDCVLLLDEVHYAADWDQHLKTLVDHHPEYRVVATGSASLEHTRGSADSGVGRWRTIPIPTLSFYEFLHIRGEAPEAIDPKLRVSTLLRSTANDRAAVAHAMRPTLPLFRHYLLVGGFPETALGDDIVECQRLLREDVVDRVLKRDIVVLFGTRKIVELEKLFLYVCLHSGVILNVSSCSSELGVPRSTIEGHLDILRQANLLYRIPRFQSGGKAPLKGRHKYYLVDAALRNAILLSGPELLDDPDEMGRVVETAILRHLFAFYYRDTPTISYWQDPKTNKEVDIVLQSPRYMIPVEVKYRAGSKPDASVLVQFCEQQDIEQGFLITRDEGAFDVRMIRNTQVAGIPAHIFCYVIGQAERYD